MGWIITIVIGGIAGYIAERLMKADMGVLANVLVGILGAVVARFLLGLVGIHVGAGILPQGIAAVAGACLLIYVYRAIKARS